MKLARSTRTDSRLDDLNDRVSDLSRRVDGLSLRIDSFQRTMVQVAVAMTAAFLAGFAALAALIATQT